MSVRIFFSIAAGFISIHQAVIPGKNIQSIMPPTSITSILVDPLPLPQH